MPSNSTSGASCKIYPIDHPTLPAGLPAQEYKHHTFKSSTTGAIQEVVLIESNEGSSFEISVDLDPATYSLLHSPPPDPAHPHQHHHPPPRQRSLDLDDYLIYVHLDGINAQRSKRHRSQRGPTKISGVYSRDLSTSRLFQFGSLNLVDPDDFNDDDRDPNDPDHKICSDEKIIQSLGTIQVNIVRCILGNPRQLFKPPSNSTPSFRSSSRPSSSSHNLPDPSTIQTTNQMKFSERTKKASRQSNTAGLSQPIPTSVHSSDRGASRSNTSFHRKKSVRPIIYEDPNPFLQFIFKYKPRSVLTADGIIPPPPPIPPSPPRQRQSSKSLKNDKQGFHPSNSNDPNQLVTKPDSGPNSDLSGTFNHDFRSNSELHTGSDDRQTSVVNLKADEKKPECPTVDYIEIDSDSDSECQKLMTSVNKTGNRTEVAMKKEAERETEMKELKMNQTGEESGKRNVDNTFMSSNHQENVSTSSGIIPKLENQQHGDLAGIENNGWADNNNNDDDQHRRIEADDLTSRKRSRSVTVDIKPPKKRISDIGNGHSTSSMSITSATPVTAMIGGDSRTIENKSNDPSQIQKIDPNENVKPNPNHSNTTAHTSTGTGTTMMMNRAALANHHLYDQEVVSDDLNTKNLEQAHDEDSDEDEKFKDKMLRGMLDDSHTRTDHSSHVPHDDQEVEEQRTKKVDQKSFTSNSTNHHNLDHKTLKSAPDHHHHHHHQNQIHHDGIGAQNQRPLYNTIESSNSAFIKSETLPNPPTNVASTSFSPILIDKPDIIDLTLLDDDP